MWLLFHSGKWRHSENTPTTRPLLPSLTVMKGHTHSQGLPRAGADTYPDHRKHYQIDFLPGGSVEQGGEEGPVWDAGRSSLFPVHMCFCLETTCSLSFLGILIRS